MPPIQYDYSVVQFSPEGRVYQIEYAEKAADKGDTTVGIKCVDGLVIAIANTITSKLLKTAANPKLLPISQYAALAISGIQADGRALANESKDIVRDYERQYGTPIPNQTLAHRIAGEVHNSTIYGNVRPVGCSAILGAYSPEDGPQLYLIQPNAECYRYFATSGGKHKQAVSTELEKIQFDKITVKEAVELMALIFFKVHDEIKDPEFDIEFMWMEKDTGFKLQSPPKDFVQKCVLNAQEEKRKAVFDDDMSE